jgi:hypothetical protein
MHFTTAASTSTAFSRARAIAGSVLVVATALCLVACSSDTALVPTVSPTSATTDSAAEPLMSPPQGDADWECGQASALFAIQMRSEWEVAHSAIDQAEFDARHGALVDAWTYFPVGRSDVTPAVRATIAAAEESGVSNGNAAFAGASAELAASCEAAGSVIIIGALPSMGG